AKAPLLFLLFDKARKLLLEAREPAATVEQLLMAAGPGRMRLRVDVEMQDVALLAPRRAGGEFRAVGHLDRDRMVVRVGILLHDLAPLRRLRQRGAMELH